MKTHNQASTPRFLFWVLVALSLLVASCGDDSGISCGEGTLLDLDTGTCIVDDDFLPPDFNAIITQATIGQFQLTNLSYPDEMSPGIEQTHNFTITNMSPTESELTLMRVSVAQGSPDEIRSYLEKVAGVGAVCPTGENCASQNVLDG